MDSLDGIELMMKFEEIFHISIPDDEMEAMLHDTQTPGGIYQWICTALEDKRKHSGH